MRGKEVPESVRTEKQSHPEFFSWCDAVGPCCLNGVDLDETKIKFNHLVTPRKVDMYLDYIVKRKKKVGDKEGTLSLASIRTLLNGLSALQSQQIDTEPGSFTSPEMKTCIWTKHIKQRLDLLVHEQGSKTEAEQGDFLKE